MAGLAAPLAFPLGGSGSSGDYNFTAAVPLSGTVIRLSFDSPVRAVNPLAGNDALYVANYTFTGPAAATPVLVSTVLGDPLSVDVYFTDRLAAGTWTVSVVNVVSSTNETLQQPATQQFFMAPAGTTEDVTGGATNDTAEEIIRKHLSPAIRGPATDALIAALASGDAKNFENARKAFDQLFKISASGVYLSRKAGDDGVTKPADVGMSDETFRRYAIQTTNKKVVIQAVLEVLEIFYGSDAVRAFAETGVAEPFTLAPGDELRLKIDERDELAIVFNALDFNLIGAATALEVVAAINRAFLALNMKHFAVVFTDPISNQRKVRIYSRSLGLGSAVRITGGKAQNILKFSTPLLTLGGTSIGVSAAEQWDISEPRPGIMRFTRSGATLVSLLGVKAGDYVNVYGAPFPSYAKGSFPIVNVDVRYVAGVLTQSFEVETDEAITPAPIVTALSTDIIFFRPKKATINDAGSRTVIASQPTPDILNLVLPATTLAVERTIRTAAYVVARPSITASSVTRLDSGDATIVTPDPHGLLQGEYVFLQDVRPLSTKPVPTAGNGTSTTDTSPVTLWSALANMSGRAYNHGAVTMNNGKVLIVGGHDYSGGDLGALTTCRRFSITSSAVLANGGTQHTYLWETAAALPVATESMGLTVLQDASQSGNVLKSGGWDGTTIFSTSYIYNAGANTWSANIPMGSARVFHTATHLNDGRVLAAGGVNAGTTAVATAEAFTPSGGGGAWANVASMGTARAEHAAVKLSDGRVLVIGGRTNTSTDSYLASCEIYDPNLNTWTATGTMGVARGLHKAFLLPDGRVMVIGGRGFAVSRPDAVANLASCEVWDPRTGMWTYAAPMGNARLHFEAQYLSASRKIVVFGGDGVVFMEYLDVDTGKWSRGPDAAGRSRGASAVLPSGTVLFAGGYISSVPVASEAANLFVPDSDAFAAGGLNTYAQITSVPSPTSFVVATPDAKFFTAAGALTVIPTKALPATTLPGPYLMDPTGGVTVRGVETTTTMDLNRGQQYRSVTVANGAAFPNEEGYLAFAFGTKVAAQPVKYLGKISANELVLDYRFKFPATVPQGAKVTLLSGKGPWDPTPAVAEDIGAFYLTASASGRVAAQATIDAIVAAGVDVRKTIIYPGDRGLGGEGLPGSGAQKLSDKVWVWGGNDPDTEIQAAREQEEE